MLLRENLHLNSYLQEEGIKKITDGVENVFNDERYVQLPNVILPHWS